MAASSPRNDLVKIYRCTDSLVDLFTGRAGVVVRLLLHLSGICILVRLEHPREAAEPDSDYIECGRAEDRAVLSILIADTSYVELLLATDSGAPCPGELDGGHGRLVEDVERRPMLALACV